jgi:hypothetical protein
VAAAHLADVMSAVTLSSDTAASMLAGGTSQQAHADSSLGREFYAAWKAVFEHSRASEPGLDGAWRRDAGLDEACSEHASRAAVADVQSETSVGHDVLPSDERSGGVPNMTRVAVLAKPVAANRAPANIATIAVAGQAPQLLRVAGAEKAAAQAAAIRTAHEPAAAGQPVAIESVQVFIQGAAVAIVVRDTSLSADEAMRCAFQTARELTGRSDGLHQLTLNGRTLYQQQRSGATQEPAPAAGQGASVLEFAC